jgi:hypothetical protein
MLFQTAGGVDGYLNATGFVSGTEAGAAPSVRDFIKGRIRNYVVRTMEPRIHAINMPAIVGAAFFDFYTLSDNIMGGKQMIQIKAYNVALNGGVKECPTIAAVTNGMLIPFEIEYTSHSGAEA